MSSRIETFEVFRYKVVYPGGTYVRISPALESEKTGIILEFGTVFEASKSLFLDGTNYAKLSDGSGWVFDKKNGIEILQLLEVVRIKKSILEVLPSQSLIVNNPRSPNRNTSMDNNRRERVTPYDGNTQSQNSSRGDSKIMNEMKVSHPNNIPTMKKVRSETRIWREIRSKCIVCQTFADFEQLVANVESQTQINLNPGVSSGFSDFSQKIYSIDGPTRSSWMATESSHHDHQVRGCIALIASITRKCSSDVR